jgi:PAS domain S-box-containing protein
MILVVDDGSIIESMNPAGERMLGYSASEVVGRRIDFLIPHLTLRHAETFETIGRHKDGRTIDLEVDVAQIRVEGRCLFSILGRDITRRKELEKDLVAIGWREQARIGQDLHDTVCQYLVGIQFMCGVLGDRLTQKGISEAANLGRIAELTSHALTVTRTLAKGLFPKLTHNGLVPALKEWASQTAGIFGIDILIDCPAPISIEDSEIPMHVYRIAQEAVRNSIRHGKASRVSITLGLSESVVSLTVEDDGLGIPEDLGAERGMGLDIMKHRATAIGATVAINRSAKGGTIVVCSFRIPNRRGQKKAKAR